MDGPPPIQPGDRVEVRVSGDDDRAAAEALAAARGARLVTRDPGVVVTDEWTAEHDPGLLAARRSGAAITTLAEMIIDRHAGPWIAVTGTAGKSSTCHALAHILRASGRRVRMSDTARSGNAWPDWSLAQLEPDPDAVLVAELTSSHLCHMDTPLAPDVAVVTLLRPDHPDLHPSPDAYVAAKARLVPPVGHPRALVLPADDPATLAALPAGVRADAAFGSGRADVPGAYLVGGSSVEIVGGGSRSIASWGAESPTATRAALAAAAAALAFGVRPAAVADGLAAITAPAHRQRIVGRFRDAWIVDDTMAATPRKALAAIRHFRGRDPVLVMGGDPCVHPPGDAEAAVAEIRGAGLRVVTFGPAGDVLAPLLDARATAPTVMGALATAATIAGKEGLVLVSPMYAMQPAERERVAALPEA